MTQARDLRDPLHRQFEDPTEDPDRVSARPEIEAQGSAGGAECCLEGATSPASVAAAYHDIPVEG